MTPIQQALLMAFVALCASMVSAYLVNRLTNRQDRRVDWFDRKDEQDREHLEALRSLTYRLTELEGAFRRREGWAEAKDQRDFHMAGKIEGLERRVGEAEGMCRDTIKHETRLQLQERLMERLEQMVRERMAQYLQPRA